MAEELKFQRTGHCAVTLGNCVVVIGGCWITNKPSSTNVIWMYNLYTNEWRKHSIVDKGCAPEPFHGAAAVTIDGIIFIFGGVSGKDSTEPETNALWTLCRTPGGSFTWSFINPHCKEESPSPRVGHTGWEYTRNMWIFGGAGPSPEGYLNGHGDTDGVLSGIMNNQLLCYNPNTQKWTNPQCSGSIPTPRIGHASAIINDKLWLFGGYNLEGDDREHVFELRMNSLTWSQIKTAQPGPKANRFLCTLTALTDNKLVLHGGTVYHHKMTPSSNTWILDLTSHSWRQYKSITDHARNCHTGSLGPNSNIIIIGGFMESEKHVDEVYESVFHVMLGPKSLQLLAMQMIQKYRDDLPWICLPKRLISQLGISTKR